MSELPHFQIFSFKFQSARPKCPTNQPGPLEGSVKTSPSTKLCFLLGGSRSFPSTLAKKPAQTLFLLNDVQHAPVSLPSKAFLFPFLEPHSQKHIQVGNQNLIPSNLRISNNHSNNVKRAFEAMNVKTTGFCWIQ